VRNNDSILAGIYAENDEKCLTRITNIAEARVNVPRASFPLRFGIVVSQ